MYPNTFTMSQRKPVCQKFLDGKCRGKCDFFHPKNGGKKKQYDGPRRNERQPYRDTNRETQNPAGHQRLNVVEMPQPVITPPQQEVAVIPEIPQVDPEIEKARRAELERNIEMRLNALRIAKKAERDRRIAERKAEKALKAQVEAPAFTQESLNKWIINIMKIVEEEDSLIILYTTITKKRVHDIMDFIKATHIVVPDIIAFLGRAQTNQDWLKELQIRFLDFSYTGIKSFTMDAIKPLFSFIIVQLYVKCKYNNYDQLDKFVGLFICIIKLIQKLGIVIELEEYSTVEYNWNAGLYEIWN